MSIERILESEFLGASFTEASSFTEFNKSQLEESYKDNLATLVKKTVLENEKPNDREFLMEGIAGYSPVRLVARYMLLSEQMSKKGMSSRKINEVFSEMVVTDTKAYAEEFLYRSPVLQNKYEILNIDEIKSVVQPSYDPSSPLHTHVSLKEREGASFTQVLELEKAILNAKNHSTIIYTSPMGWNGVSIPFVESQVHVVNIVDNEIIDTTLRNSFSLDQIQLLVEELSGNKIDGPTDRERIKEICQTVVLIPKDITPENILMKMSDINHGGSAWDRMKLVKDKEGNQKIVLDRTFSFDQIKTVLRKGSFIETNNEVKNIIKNLSDYLKENANTDGETLCEMVRNIGRAALTISESIGVEVGELTERKTQKGDYSEATKYASEGLACDTPSSSQSRESQYARDGVGGRCVQCGDKTLIICGWCIKCAEAGQNYKLIFKNIGENIERENIYGSLIGFLISGAFSLLN